ncbi:serine hydrolase [Streptomyces sp. INR7]|uniref:serine hydrolase domain-containing protein n=1 Tax=Streptomyces sp. INR7 TaxID=2607753 RepID=UPI001625107F|nr:serine hydrolase domain-containing protein [Streptomyces sp. INR7]QNE28340.1 beta-lactamase family protein [Streptomyces sp. INR7]
MGEQKRKRLRPVAAATAVAVMTLSTLTAAAPSVAARPRPDTLQRSLDRLVRSDGLPAALASVTGRDGRTRTYVAGAGDLATGAEVPRDGQVRIGSNTKTFTAVVVLQLVGEGRVGLDAPVETYLPGLVRGDGIDGRHITVRQLLQHMSGLPNYTEYDLQPRPYDPRDLLDIALRHKAHFAPGTKWEYSNTNYVLAGLIVEKVTGRDLAREIDRRIIQRLGLRHTYFPAPGDVTIREPHPHGYHRETADGPLRDITDMDPSWSWAAGQLISTNSDLNRFFSELLRGRLLPDAQLAQMRTTVPADYFGRGAGYGLGLVSRPLSCGGVYWGHGGSFPGYETRGGATEHGRRAAHIAVTTQPADKTVMERVDAAVDRALCP